MPRIVLCLAAVWLGIATASAQSLYAPAPGAFAAVGTFGLQEYSPNDVALSAELGYRLGNGLDLGLGVRHTASETRALDYGSESSAWEVRPALGYLRPLGTHTAWQVRGVVSARASRSTSGGFSFGPTTVKATRFDADLSALVVGRVRLGDRLAILPGAGLYHLRTLADKADVSYPYECGDVCAVPSVGDDVAVRSTGVEFALPIALRLGEQHLVLSPTVRYALSDTYQILERVADVSLRYNF